MSLKFSFDPTFFQKQLIVLPILSIFNSTSGFGIVWNLNVLTELIVVLSSIAMLAVPSPPRTAQ